MIFLEPTPKYKYLNHSGKQFHSILTVAKGLFIERGIEQVSISDITDACGIMRATFYRYFKNKDAVLWEIMHQCSGVFETKLLDRLENLTGTTYERFSALMDVIYDIYLTDIDIYRFMSAFKGTYQQVTSIKNNPVYDQFYAPDDFRTGDAVRLLELNFHDGSIRPDLDAHETAVTVHYTAMSMAISMANGAESMPAKYSLDAGRVLRASLDLLLKAIRAC